MPKKPAGKPTPPLTLEAIKIAAITAMFRDNKLFEMLVLKGGNALDLIHKLSNRASVDLDFSMKHDLPKDGAGEFCKRVETALRATFVDYQLEVIDVKMEERPETVSEELAEFWGGYAIEFKLVQQAVAKEFAGMPEEVRKRALSLGRGTKFLIDISRYEYIDGKEERNFEGYRIFVYSPEMIVCEKLRALCQQMPAYGEVIKRKRPGTARARDFLDIYVLVDKLKLNLLTAQNRHILGEMFQAKKVPLSLLGTLHEFRDFHRAEFPAVQATVKPGVKLEDFDYYFDYVLKLVEELKPLWNV